jgi:hypothetical protein
MLCSRHNDLWMQQTLLSGGVGDLIRVGITDGGPEYVAVVVRVYNSGVQAFLGNGLTINYGFEDIRGPVLLPNSAATSNISEILKDTVMKLLEPPQPIVWLVAQAAHPCDRVLISLVGNNYIVGTGRIFLSVSGNWDEVASCTDSLDFWSTHCWETFQDAQTAAARADAPPPERP